MSATVRKQPEDAAAPSMRPPRVVSSLPRFDEIVHEHSERIGGLCYRLLGWNADVDDVVQEVFLAAYEALPTFRGESKMSTWLTAIAINACRNHLRKRKRWLRWFTVQKTEHSPVVALPAGQALADYETHAEVRAAVQELPQTYREVVVLRYLEELEVADIAGVLALAKNTVEVRLSRARGMLRDVLGDSIERDCDEC